MTVQELKSKAKEMSNKIFNSFWFTIIIGVILLLKTFLFYSNTVAINEPLESETIIGSISFIVTLVCFLSILPNRGRTIVTTIVNTILSTLLFGDNLYYTFSSNALSVAQISNAQYGNEIMKTLPMVLDIIQIWYFIDIIILALLWILRFLKLKKGNKITKKKSLVKLTTALVGVILFCLIGYSYVEKGKQKSYNKDMQIREATIYGYHISDIINEIDYKNTVKYKNYDEMKKDYDLLKEQYEENYGEVQYNLKGILKDKNVIVLQLESVQEFVVNKMINGVEITPNLNRFLRENIEFSNMYMQSYSTTADSEHTIITSAYPLENGMCFSKHFANTYDDIFKNFKNGGYSTTFMHGNYPYFWNRGNVYSRLNLDNTVFKEDFEDISENINGDLSDELLYTQAIFKIKSYDNPFFVNIVAASSHTPFVLDGLQDRESKIKIDVGKYKDTYFGNYIEAMNYADYAFGVFIEELKKEGLYNDTAILVFGDHNGLNMYNDELIDFLTQINPDIKDVDIKLCYTRVLCGLKIPGVKHKKIDKPINKLDVKPTLSYLCDLEDGISLGTNMFESKDFVCLNNGRIITDKYYYDEYWYSIETGEMIDLEVTSQDEKNLLNYYTNCMKTELEISDSIIVNNLLKNN